MPFRSSSSRFMAALFLLSLLLFSADGSSEDSWPASQTYPCCGNTRTPNTTARSGHVEKLGGLNAYVNGPPDSKFAVLLASDIYGYTAPNLRTIADNVAAAGFYAVVPDFFHGDPYNAQNKDRPQPIWIKDHAPEKGFEESKPVIEALKCKGITAVGVAGYCWGGKVAVELAKQGLVKAVVLLHPSYVTLDDIKDVKAPIAIFGAENDHKASPELLKQFQDILATKPKVPSFVKVFPNVSHGWSLKYNPNDPAAVKPAEEARQDMLCWFTKHLK